MKSIRQNFCIGPLITLIFTERNFPLIFVFISHYYDNCKSQIVTFSFTEIPVKWCGPEWQCQRVLRRLLPRKLSMIFTAQLYKRKVWRKSECMSVLHEINLFTSLSFVLSYLSDWTDEHLACSFKRNWWGSWNTKIRNWVTVVKKLKFRGLVVRQCELWNCCVICR